MSFKKEENINTTSISSSDIPELKGAAFTSNASSDAPTTRWAKIKHSFKEADLTNQDESGLKKDLSLFHVGMVALSTGVGTGLWVGSGKSLAGAGPASLLIGYAIIASMVYFVIDAAGEMAVAYADLPGSFISYPKFFVEKSFAFSVSWNYYIMWLSVFSLELVTASMTIKYWTDVNSDAFVAPLYIIIMSIHFFGAKGYGDAEIIFNGFKLLTLLGFVIFGIVTDVGGAGHKEYIGAKYWHDPGAFNHGFKGLCSVFVSAAFAFGGTEFVALTAAEQRNPRRALPLAIKVVVYRIIFIFLLSLTIITMLVPYNDDELMGSGGSASHSSPFVIAAASHGVKVVPHLINSVILLSVLSVANSAVYSSSRIGQALASQGFAPKALGYTDNAGRPLYGLIIAAIAGLFAFIAAYEKQEVVFNWLLSISGLSTIFTFTAICVSHIRFRKAMHVQGRSLGELGYKTKFGVWGSYYAIFINILVLMAQFWIALTPLGSAEPDANNFFQNYLGAVVLIVFYIAHKIYSKNLTFLYKAEDIDLVSHRKIFDEELLKQEQIEHDQHIKNSNIGTKILNFFF